MSKTCASLPPMNSKAPTPDQKSERVDAARRRLLKAGAYAAPVVLGSLLASSAAAKPCSPNNPTLGGTGGGGKCSCTPQGTGGPNC